MKTLFLILFCFPFFGEAQKIVLIDRNFYHPISTTDSISWEQVSKGLLPVYHKDLKSITAGMEWLAKHLRIQEIEGKQSFTLKMGNSKCIVTKENNRRMDKYSIVFNSEINDIKTSIVLAAGEPDKRALQRIAIFMDYLKNNSSLSMGKL